MSWKEKIEQELEAVDFKFIILLAILGVSTYMRFRYAFFEGMWVDEGRYGRIALDIAQHPLSYSTTEAWKGTITGIPPVYPYLLAISSAIFPNDNFAIRIVSPVMAVVGIGLTYILGKEMRDIDTGLIAAILVSVAPTYWFLSERVLIGATLAAVYTAAVLLLYYGLEDREYSDYALYALGPVTAIALLTKQPAYTLGPVLLVYFLYRKQDELQELWETRDLEYAKTEFKSLGIGIILGLITLAPWSIRNMGTCGFPLCGLQRALSFASQSGSASSAVFSVQNSFYFFQNLPRIVSIPVAILVAVRVLYYILKRSEELSDLAKRLGAIVALTGITYVLKQNLFPMALITSLALLPSSKEEKLLWIWTGFGIGFMSIPEIKVPRYIGFVIPALGLITAYMIKDTSAWIKKVTGKGITGPIFVIGIIAATLYLAVPIGLQNAELGGYEQLESAGDWVDENTQEDAVLAASSNRQLMFYAYPRDVYFPEDNRTVFEQKIKDENISYLIVDTYEKAQAKWLQQEVPPYRIPNEDRQRLRSAQRSGNQRAYQQAARDIASNFRRTPAYLNAVAEFGSQPMPLRRNQEQPRVMVYRINQSVVP